MIIDKHCSAEKRSQEVNRTSFYYRTETVQSFKLSLFFSFFADRVSCYPEKRSDCIWLMDFDRMPFLRDFQPREHQIYGWEAGLPSLNKVTVCKEFVEEEERRRSGEPPLPAAQPIHPENDFDCRSRDKLLTMGFLERGKRKDSVS